MKKVIFPTVLLLAAITGCSQTASICSDDEVLSLAKDAIHNESKPTDRSSYAVSKIKTQEVNESTGSASCSAQLSMNNQAGDRVITIPMTYDVKRVGSTGKLQVTARL